MKWEPCEIKSWASVLGMADVALFGSDRENLPPGRHAVMLDGATASFSISIGDDQGLLLSLDPLSWAWSSHLRHAVVFSRESGHLFLRRWDAPGNDVRLRVPRSASEAEDLLTKIAKGHRPRVLDVVAHMIAAFKSFRATLSAYGAENLDVVLAFNMVITALERDETGDSLTRCRRLGDIMALVPPTELVSERLAGFRDAYVEAAISVVLNAAPGGLPPLNPHLLIRHASGQLFQEAHFELERQLVVQQTFWGREPNQSLRGQQQRDARFTPPELARSLVEQALRQVSKQHLGDLTVLDPACGCGVFLQETLRELERLEYKGQVRLIGFDSSDVSVAIADFCLERAVQDANAAGMRATATIQRQNAMLKECEWGSPSLILMNPPFASYKDMDQRDQRTAQEVLGGLAFGHFDKAMAFVWKAVQSVAPGGAVASVIPSTLLDSRNGYKWRAALVDRSELCAVGRFAGYGYFPGAMVEPGFLVFRNRDQADTQTRPLTILLADEGSEDVALRSLRKGNEWTESTQSGYFLSLDHRREAVSASVWMPKTLRHEALLKAIPEGTPTVGELFDVNQGGITGMNAAFILKDDVYSSLPEHEKEFFRPAAGTNTIRKGQLLCRQWVFFPYNHSGLRLKTEDEVKTAVGEFYSSRLKPNERSLSQRRDKQDRWWTLTEPRTWQYESRAKIVTAYFGTSGHFAYDSAGEFVCIQGYAWNRSDSVSVTIDPDEGDADDASREFYETELPWAYVAILNSEPFRVLLSLFCSRVQGGQFNLSRRFVEGIPIPDLIEGPIPGDVVESLIGIGREFSEGIAVDQSRLAGLVARAYGVALTTWNLEERLRRG